MGRFAAFNFCPPLSFQTFNYCRTPQSTGGIDPEPDPEPEQKPEPELIPITNTGAGNGNAPGFDLDLDFNDTAGPRRRRLKLTISQEVHQLADLGSGPGRQGDIIQGAGS